jgi:hypothetical protein
MGYGYAEGELHEDGTASFPIRQYRKKGAVWVKIWEGDIDVDLTGPYGDNPYTSTSSPMEGSPIGDAVAKMNPESESSAMVAEMGDYFSFKPVEVTSPSERRARKRNLSVMNERLHHLNRIRDQHMQGMKFIANGTKLTAVPRKQAKKAAAQEHPTVILHGKSDAAQKEYIQKAQEDHKQSLVKQQHPKQQHHKQEHYNHEHHKSHRK